MKKLLATLLFLFLLSPLFGTIYYVDTAADPGGDGTTQATTGANCAWDTVADVNAASFSAGDFIYFKRACEWRETLTPPDSGSEGSLITFGAYGEGALPIINGSDLITTWVEHDEVQATETWGENSGDDYNSVCEDNYISEGASTTNYGTNVALTLKESVGACRHVILRFDISAIAGATIVSATLKLTIYTDNGANTQYVHKILQTAWVVGESTWDIYSTGNNWNTAGAYGDGTDVDGTLDTSTGALATITIDEGDIVGDVKSVTGLGSAVQDVLASGSFEIILSQATDQALTHRWDSSDSTDGERPYLEITYTTPNGAANVWTATNTTEPRKVFFDGVVGTVQASAVACTGANEWFWEGDVLYVYSTGDPDDDYTDPGIESTTRDKAVDVANHPYIRLENLHATKGNTHNIRYSGSSANGELAGLMVSHGGLNGVIFINTSHYMTMDDCTIHHNGVSGSEAGTGVGVSTDAYGATFMNSTSYNNAEDGFGQGSGCGTAVPNTYTDLIAYDNEENGIDIKGGVGAIIDSCTISGSGLYGVSIDDNAVDVTFRYCSITDGSYGCFSISGDGGHQFYYNIMENISVYFAIRIYMDVGDETVSLYNNTIYQTVACVDPAIYVQRLGTFNFKNNIIYTVDSLCMHVDDIDAVWNVDNNCYYRDDAGDSWDWNGEGTTDSLSTWQGWSSGDASSINSDPTVTDIANENYILQVGSPCIDAGTDVSLTKDYEGDLVPQGSAPEIGAYELSTIIPPSIPGVIPAIVPSINPIKN